MASKKFSEFEYVDEIEVDLASMPEQRGQFDPLPQPGRNFVVQLPEISLDDEAWDEEKADGDSYPVYTFNPSIGKGAMIVASPHGEEEVGRAFRFRCTSAPRSFATQEEIDAGMPAKFSTMGYVISAIAKSEGKALPALKTLAQWVKAFQACSGKQLVVDLKWATGCSPDRNKYVQDAESGDIVESEGEVGCGQRYEEKRRRIKGGKHKGDVVQAIPKVEVDANGLRGDEVGFDPDKVVRREYATRWVCETEGCDAVLSPFIEVKNIRPTEIVEPAEPEPAPTPTPEPTPAAKSAPAPAAKPAVKAAPAKGKK